MNELLDVDKVVKQRKLFERDESDKNTKNLENPLEGLRLKKICTLIFIFSLGIYY